MKLFERLDAIVREAGGRIYAAKDARMPRDLFESGYPRLGEFLQLPRSGNQFRHVASTDGKLNRDAKK